MPHYYDENPKGEVKEIEITETLRGKVFSFTSASGLFSKEHTDNATKLLINKCQIEEAKKILDLGCGWGPVITVLATEFPKKEFIGVDINKRAIKYTKKNCQRQGLKNVRVFSSNILDKLENEKVDVILTNPPYAAGRKICFDFINNSFEHLVKGGSLQLVARHKKGGKTLMKKMEEVFGNVNTIGKKSGFHLYKSVKE